MAAAKDADKERIGSIAAGCKTIFHGSRNKGRQVHIAASVQHTDGGKPVIEFAAASSFDAFVTRSVGGGGAL